MNQKPKMSRGMRLGCIAIATWFVLVFVVLITIPFRPPPAPPAPPKAEATTDAKELLAKPFSAIPLPLYIIVSP